MTIRTASIFLVMLLLISGCHDSQSQQVTSDNKIPQTATLYLSCQHFTIQNLGDETFGFYNRDGELFFRHEDSSLWFNSSPFRSSGKKSCDVPVSVERGGKYGYIMPDGSLFASRLFENSSAGLYKNLLAYSEQGRWGLIREDGKIIVSPAYDQIRGPSQGPFPYRAKLGGKRLLMNAEGRTMPIEESENYSAKYDQLLPSHHAYTQCPDNTRIASHEGRWGIVDNSGNVLVPFEHRAISCLDDDVFRAPDEQNKRWCRYNRDGSITSSCSPRFTLRSNVHANHESFVDDVFENSVIWNRKYLDYGEGREDEPPAYVKHLGQDIIPAYPSIREQFESDWYR